jgi:hypothetical protein
MEDPVEGCVDTIFVHLAITTSFSGAEYDSRTVTFPLQAHPKKLSEVPSHFQLAGRSYELTKTLV